MALINTGLGWAADDGYLMQSDGIMATLEGFAPGSVLLPYTPTETDLKNNGLAGFERSGETSVTANYITYYGNKTENTQVIICAVGQQLFFITPSPNVHIAEISYYTRSTNPWLYSWTDRSLWYTHNTYYFWNTNTLGATYHIDPAVPAYSTVEEMWADIDFIAEFVSKANSGYAVACMCKYNKTDGEHLEPILISSVDNNTVFSFTYDTYPQTITSHLKGGMRFTMRSASGLPNSLRSSNVSIIDLTAYPTLYDDRERLFREIASVTWANIQILDAPDPYEEEGDASEEDGGDGQTIDDDPVEEQTNPLPSVAGLGFCTVYVPSQSELLAMSSYLWSGSFDVTQVIKLFSNPLDSIIGLSAVPVDLTGTSEQIYLGGVALTGVTMPRYTGRTAVKVDMGTVTINERYGAYLDYDPYTEFDIYVPFVGIKNLKADDIMGKTLSLMYDIDILTGACVAYLRPVGESVLYEWAGQCAQQIPVTSSNWDNIFRNAMTAASSLGTALLAPASAPVLAGAVASAASQAIAAKPRVDRSGSLTGVSGWLGQLRPYIIRTIPEAYIPADQNKFIGYPAYINVSMAAISGYNEVASIHLEGIPATGNELAEIESLLKGGVIF